MFQGMGNQANRQIIFNQHPEGWPERECFRLEPGDSPEPKEGEVLLRTTWLSVDPYMRGRMNPGPSYIPPFELGQPIEGGVVARVEQSRHASFPEGTFVQGMLPWADYSVSDGVGLYPVDPSLAPVQRFLGVLGMPGLTAWFGLMEIGKPQPGETVVVSGAAGAVGSLAGQLARQQGCRVVGIAGSEEKVNWIVNELGFDAGINYKATPDLLEALRAACPKGVDIHFDNVGGSIADALLLCLNRKGRIVLCGQISQYNLTEFEQGPRSDLLLVGKSARKEGFIVTDFQDRFHEGVAQLGKLHASGSIRVREQVWDGLERAPDAFLGLFRGENLGKALVRVWHPDQSPTG
jgi:NADPH-dependent curcumin reductase CurA